MTRRQKMKETAFKTSPADKKQTPVSPERLSPDKAARIRALDAELLNHALEAREAYKDPARVAAKDDWEQAANLLADAHDDEFLARLIPVSKLLARFVESRARLERLPFLRDKRNPYHEELAASSRDYTKILKRTEQRVNSIIEMQGGYRSRRGGDFFEEDALAQDLDNLTLA